MIRISIITVCFNAEASIEHTIQSVCDQIYPNKEYIIIDGLSTDKTMKIIRKNSYRINKIISEKDSGIYDAMNKGLALATGDVINFLNADDSYSHNDVLLDVAHAFEVNASKALIYGKANYINVPEGITPPSVTSLKSLDDFLVHYTLCHQAVFAKKRLFSELGGFDSRYKYSADFEWLIRAYKSNAANFYFLDKELVNFSYSGMSNRRAAECRKEVAFIRFKHLFSISKFWYFFRYIVLRGAKKFLLKEEW